MQQRMLVLRKLKSGEVMELGVRDESELRDMLIQASKTRDAWLRVLTNKEYEDKEGMVRAVRNYNALRGVIKTLQWALRHPLHDSPLT
tara:strand:- start:292 stop:555 length:264 start_codon:yes stop_codon:yes gene_type:complete